MRDYSADPRMIVVLSFNVNKPGQDIRSMVGGIAGGSILQGCFRIGDLIEIRPGRISKAEGGFVCRPWRTRITSLRSEGNELEFAVPAG
jgi:translation initiation factor 2 subunit 3